MRALVLVTSVAVAFLSLLLLAVLFGGPGAGSGGADGRPEDPDRPRLVRLLAAGEDVKALRKLHAEFVAEDEPEWAENCVGLILSIAPQDEWANQRAGRADLREIYERIPDVPDLEFYPNPAAERLLALREAGIAWGTAADRDAVEELLESATEHAIRLRGDPVYRDEWLWRTWMSRHPIFKDLPTICDYTPPYLLFADVGPRPGGEEASRRLLGTASARLGRLYEVFREEFAARNRLPDLVDEARSELRIAKAFLFTDERLYRGYQNLIRDPVAPGVEAHYRLDDQWIVLYAGGDMTERLLFTGVQQLLHFYRKIVVDRTAGEDVPWKDDRLVSRLPWFETGFARFLGSAREGEDGKLVLMAPNRELLEAWCDDDLLAGDAPVLADMVSAGRDGGGPGLEPYPAAAAAWSFCHFLWWYDGGRYRDRLRDYVGEEIHGRSGPEIFARVFGGDREPDWTTVEAEWRAYVKDLAKREGVD